MLPRMSESCKPFAANGSACETRSKRVNSAAAASLAAAKSGNIAPMLPSESPTSAMIRRGAYSRMRPSATSPSSHGESPPLLGEPWLSTRTAPEVIK
eukprot:3259725-Prymnesium_polylepis.1